MKNDFLEKDIKLIAFDMDGTLLNDNKEISKYTIDVLNKAVDCGVKLVPITGRPIQGLLPLIPGIKGVKYVVTSNGAVITDIVKNAVIKEYSLDKEKAIEAYDLAVSLGQGPSFFINGYSFREEGDIGPLNGLVFKPSKFKENMDAMIKKYGLREVAITSGYPIEKVTIFFDSVENKYKALKDFGKIEGITISYAFDSNLEVNALGVTKGRALEEIAEMFNIPIENTMAIGDGINDISMIEKAGVGVVMGNALEELKDHGDYVTLANNEDGAAKAIEKFLFKYTLME